MDDVPEKVKTRRLSSILKIGGGGNVSDSPTETFSRPGKRISFSLTHNVKEFAVGESNGTIWGKSYENIGKGGSSIEQSTGNIFAPATDTIELFADIEEVQMMDIEVKKPSQSRESVIQRSVLKDCNQTILMDQTCDISKVNTVIGGGNKRKSTENMSMEDLVAQSSLEKVRKVNGSKVNLNSIPNRTILENVSMESEDLEAGKLNVTHIHNSLTDDFSKELITEPHSVEFFRSLSNQTITTATEMRIDDQSMVVKPNLNKTQFFGHDDTDSAMEQSALMLNTFSTTSNKTSRSIYEMTIDDQSMSSSIRVNKPKYNHTHIFARDDTGAAIEQTLLTGNQLEDINLSQFSFASDRLMSRKIENFVGNSDSRVVDQSNSNESTTFRSTFNNTNDHIEDLTISMNINFIADKEDETLQSSILEDETLQSSILEDETLQSSILEDEKKDSKKDIKDSLLPNVRQIASLSILNDVLPLDEARDYCHVETVIRSMTKEDEQYHKRSQVMKEGSFADHIRFASPLPSNSNDNSVKVKRIKKSLLPILNKAHFTPKKVQVNDNKTTEDMSLCSSLNVESFIANRTKMSSAQSPLPAITGKREKFSSTTIFGNSINTSPYLAVGELTFTNCNPLSSTKFHPMKSLTPGSDINYELKPNQSNLSFNYSVSPTLRKSCPDVLSNNNTDDLCNLEPEQLRKQTEMKKMFLDITNDMLSETKYELHESITENSTTNSGSDAVQIEKNRIRSIVSNESRCEKCINCRRSSVGSNESYLKLEKLEQHKLDFSVYDQFEGMATIRHVIKASKIRQGARALEKQSLMDQNVTVPSWEELWENKTSSMVVSSPPNESALTCCFPMGMDITFLLRNKMATEYKKWKYFDNFVYIGAIALRHEKIPSIRIHIKFDSKGPERAQHLNIPLVFKRVFVEECPYYLKNISARNYLKHKHALAMLPLELTTMCSHSGNMFEALSQLDEWFESVVAQVKELDEVVIESEAFLKMDEHRQCYIERTIFDIEKLLAQEFVIKLDEIDKVGPRNVFFDPRVETTDEFKNLPLGLAFLRTFLRNPKSYILPFINC